MQLTEAQTKHFQEHGYLVVPRFYSDREVTALRVELERLRRVGRLRNVATDGDGKTHSSTIENLQLCPISPHSALYRAMPFDPRVVEATRALLGDPVVLHQVFLKPARHGSGTNWHQDNAYFKIADPLKGTAMWVAIHDATLANGTIHVIPDVFREQFPHDRDPYSDHHIRCYPPEERAVPVELAAGGVVFFAYGTPHCTRANATDRDRAGVAFHFLNADYAPQAALLNSGPMKHPYLSGPQADGGLDAYGTRIAGTWEQEVSRVLQSQGGSRLSALGSRLE